MLLGEAGWRDASKAAVRSDLVEVLSPRGFGSPSLGQRLEPVLVQALVAELAVEALDVAVLHRPAGLDQDVPNAVPLRPRHEGAAGELRTVVGAHGRRVAAEPRRLIEQPRDVLARDSEVDRDLHAFVAEVVRNREAFD